MIQDLHRWWAIRYPGFPSANLVGLAFSPVKFKVPPIEGTKSDFYQLSLEEMDELFASIVLLDWSLYTIKLTIGGVHHAVSAGTRAYRRQNLHRVW